MTDNEQDETDAFLYRDDLNRMASERYETKLLHWFVPSIVLFFGFIVVSKFLPEGFLLPTGILAVLALFWLHNLIDRWAFRRDLKKNL